jgi:hypothetical protein
LTLFYSISSQDKVKLPEINQKITTMINKFPPKRSLPESCEVNRDPDLVITEQGSRYKYLPSGKTQRYQPKKGILHPPMDALVFIPDYQTILKAAPNWFDVKGILGANTAEYEGIIFRGIYRRTSQNFIVTLDGLWLRNDLEIRQYGGPVFLTFGEGKNVDFRIPVSPQPRIGYEAFDTRIYFKTEIGMQVKEIHLGHKVVAIKYK